MKCVKMVATDEIKRVNDETARSMVRKGAAVFVSKTVWKQKQTEKVES